jgi:hypothetical protein
MKKQWITLLLTLPLQLLAFSVQGDISYFRPSASILRKIYDDGWVGYKVELEQPFSTNHGFWSRISVFTDVSYFAKNGHSLGGHDRTQIRIVPLSLGFQWSQPVVDGLHFYLGAAPRYFFLHIHDHLSAVRKTTNKNGLGGMVIGGLTWDVWKQLSVDLFTSYSYKRFNKPSTPPHVRGESLQVGGLEAGAGLGWRF